MKKRLLLITGSPGIGKTTVLLKTVDALRKHGFRVGGMASRDIRITGNRVGFEVIDFDDGTKGRLAHVEQKGGPQIGRYHVNIDDLNRVGAGAVEKAFRIAEVVAIDEIGPMELLSQRFREIVTKVVESRKLAICTIHWKMKDLLIDDIKTRDDANLYEVTHENRGNLFEAIVNEAKNFLGATDKAL